MSHPIAVTGSVAYDHIMNFPGRFKDHILADKLHILNVSFLVQDLQRLRGGCAANNLWRVAGRIDCAAGRANFVPSPPTWAA